MARSPALVAQTDREMIPSATTWTAAKSCTDTATTLLRSKAAAHLQSRCHASESMCSSSMIDFEWSRLSYNILLFFHCPFRMV